jgi:hypothetical protein
LKPLRPVGVGQRRPHFDGQPHGDSLLQIPAVDVPQRLAVTGLGTLLTRRSRRAWQPEYFA